MGTFFITVLLVFLFGASFFFTSVPRNALEGFVDLSDDPNAPTQRFKKGYLGGACCVRLEVLTRKEGFVCKCVCNA